MSATLVIRQATADERERFGIRGVDATEIERP